MNRLFKLYLKSGNTIIIELNDNENDYSIKNFMDAFLPKSSLVFNWYLDKKNKMVLMNQIEGIEEIMAEIGKCSNCNSDRLTFKDGKYECLKCGSIISLDEWSKILEENKKNEKK
jgi:hypothetical protein